MAEAKLPKIFLKNEDDRISRLFSYDLEHLIQFCDELRFVTRPINTI